MKQFFKFFTASCLGVFAAMALIVLVFVVIGASAAGNKPTVSQNSVLELNVESILPEKSNNIAKTSAFSLENPEVPGLHRVKDLIEHAATDKKIKGILIKGKSSPNGQATLKSLRQSIEEFKSSDKFVYAYDDWMSQSAYYLASAADSIFLNPNGQVDIKGYAAMYPYFKGMLDKVGVKMNVFYAGDFKSATEPFRRTDMSENNRIQTKEFLEAMLKVYQEDVAASRNVSVAKVDSWMQDYLGRNASSSVESGIVDKAAYWDEVENLLRKRLDVAEDKKVKYVSLNKYANAVTLKSNSSKDRVAVVYAEGNIQYGTDDNGSISEERYVKTINKLIKDDKVKAVVLRVNSGGGSSLTSDIIWRELERLKASGKPVVASFGDLAASGGYYISAGADTIVAMPNTLTGSIGVFMMLPNAKELLNDKLGITFDEVKTHPLAVNFSTVGEMSEQEEKILQASTDEIYETFLQRVADGRGMTKEAVHEVAQGRVWTGEKAVEIGLVDVLGGLEDAVRIASEMANLEEYSLRHYPTVKEKFIDQVIKGLAASDEVKSQLGLSKEELLLLNKAKDYRTFLTDPTPQAKLPFELIMGE